MLQLEAYRIWYASFFFQEAVVNACSGLLSDRVALGPGKAPSRGVLAGQQLSWCTLRRVAIGQQSQQDLHLLTVPLHLADVGDDERLVAGQALQLLGKGELAFGTQQILIGSGS